MIVRHAGEHPAIVVSADETGATVRPCTSRPQPTWRVHWLQEWHTAGLSKPTAVQLRTIRVGAEDILARLGTISSRDAMDLI